VEPRGRLSDSPNSMMDWHFRVTWVWDIRSVVPTVNDTAARDRRGFSRISRSARVMRRQNPSGCNDYEDCPRLPSSTTRTSSLSGVACRKPRFPPSRINPLADASVSAREVSLRDYRGSIDADFWREWLLLLLARGHPVLIVMPTAEGDVRGRNVVIPPVALVSLPMMPFSGLCGPVEDFTVREAVCQSGLASSVETARQRETSLEQSPARGLPTPRSDPYRNLKPKQARVLNCRQCGVIRGTQTWPTRTKRHTGR
jgi:hypothetical protein